jgi:hypothetical protein
MKKTGFRVDVSTLRKKLEAMKQVAAIQFKPDVMDYTKKTLATASRITPVRDFSLIRSNQIQKKGNQFQRWKEQGGRGKTKAQFLAGRAPARFLYRASWGQLARSLGLQIPESQQVKNATSRRDPIKAPPRAYGQIRGGKRTFSVAMFNPFLAIPSRYKKFTGEQIIADAQKKHERQFRRQVNKRLKVTLYAIMNK